jgi:hypothetical protein
MVCAHLDWSQSKVGSKPYRFLESALSRIKPYSKPLQRMGMRGAQHIGELSIFEKNKFPTIISVSSRYLRKTNFRFPNQFWTACRVVSQQALTLPQIRTIHRVAISWYNTGRAHPKGRLKRVVRNALNQIVEFVKQNQRMIGGSAADTNARNSADHEEARLLDDDEPPGTAAL